MATIKETFESHNLWQAAYLLAMGVVLRRTKRNAVGHVSFEFGNADDRAWELAQAWRLEVDATINGPALARAYREIQAVFTTARREGGYYGSRQRNDDDPTA